MVRIVPERIAAFHRRRFDKVCESVPVPILAADLLRERGGSLRRAGERWRGMCPLCGNGARSGAFSCREDLWHCFSCGEGGDVIDLADRAVPFDSPSMACTWVAHRYGIELPERPEGWYRKNERQERLRAALEEKKRQAKRRRLFRSIMVPLLKEWGASEEEVAAAWKDFGDLPV